MAHENDPAQKTISTASSTTFPNEFSLLFWRDPGRCRWILEAFTFLEKEHVFANAMTGISCFSESRWLKAIGTTQERVFCASFLLGASFVGIVTPLAHNRALWFVSAILIVVCVGLIRKLSASKSA